MIIGNSDMYRAIRKIDKLTSYLTKSYKCKTLGFISFITLLSVNTASFALVPNPGAICPDYTTKDSLGVSDYPKLLNTSSPLENTYENMSGTLSTGIPLKINMKISDSGVSVSNTTVQGTSTNPAIRLLRTFGSPQGYTDVTLNFRNSLTDKPIYLNNVGMSLFDIDKNVNSGTGWDDYVVVTGVTKSNNSFTNTFQSLTTSGSKVTNLAGLRFAVGSENFNCRDDLDTQCQGSISFSEPVSSVTIRYTNTNNITTPTSQRIEFRLDNYCYNPEYIFSGTVFDDNGGITAAKASATKADLTTGNYANNSNYFNGVFNPSAPEIGITGSTVRLANCSSTSTTYLTQSVIGENPPVGEYQISISSTTLANNKNLCLVESRTGDSYPIRTSSESRNVGFSETKYNYPNNDFGRVIVENAALVLRKAQYVNDCPSTINYTATSMNTTDNSDPNKGFSESSINGNLIPGQCIAYRITATNRANIDINNFVMRDVLQKQGVNGATVTSVLANPALSTNDYTTSENPAIGVNGEVKTKALTLTARSKRDFYFNTKYGTITSN